MVWLVTLKIPRLWKFHSKTLEKLLKTANEADQTDLQARGLTIARQTSYIFHFEAVIQWIPNKLLAIVREPVSFKPKT